MILLFIHFSAIIIIIKLNYLNIKKEDCNLKKLLFQENHMQLSNLSFYFYYLKKKLKNNNLYKFVVLFLSLIRIHSMIAVHGVARKQFMLVQALVLQRVKVRSRVKQGVRTRDLNARLDKRSRCLH